MFIRYTVNDSEWPVGNHYICSRVGLARRSTYIVTMYFSVSVNSTGEELFTTDSQTFSGSTSSYGDVSHSSPGGGLLTTETMAVLVLIVTDSVWEQAITAGLLILFWGYVNISNGTPSYVIRKEYSLHKAQFMILGSYMVCEVLYCNLVSIVGSLRDGEVACSASDRQGSNFESCVWRAVSPHSSHHPNQFNLYLN